MFDFFHQFQWILHKFLFSTRICYRQTCNWSLFVKHMGEMKLLGQTSHFLGLIVSMIKTFSEKQAKISIFTFSIFLLLWRWAVIFFIRMSQFCVFFSKCSFYYASFRECTSHFFSSRDCSLRCIISAALTQFLNVFKNMLRLQILVLNTIEKFIMPPYEITLIMKPLAKVILNFF